MLKLYLQAIFQSAQRLYEKRDGSRSIPLTNESGSGRPKNMRIPNTDSMYVRGTILCDLLTFQLRHTMFSINLNRWGPLLILHSWRSVEGSLKGCRNRIRTRACRTASRRSTVWAAPHPQLIVLIILSNRFTEAAKSFGKIFQQLHLANESMEVVP